MRRLVALYPLTFLFQVIFVMMDPWFRLPPLLHFPHSPSPMRRLVALQPNVSLDMEICIVAKS